MTLPTKTGFSSTGKKGKILSSTIYCTLAVFHYYDHYYYNNYWYYYYLSS